MTELLNISFALSVIYATLAATSIIELTNLAPGFDKSEERVDVLHCTRKENLF